MNKFIRTLFLCLCGVMACDAASLIVPGSKTMRKSKITREQIKRERLGKKASKTNQKKALQAKSLPANSTVDYKQEVTAAKEFAKEEMIDLHKKIYSLIAKLNKLELKGLKGIKKDYAKIEQKIDQFMNEFFVRLIRTNVLTSSVRKHLNELSADVKSAFAKLHKQSPTAQDEILNQVQGKLMGFAKFMPGGSLFGSLFSFGKSLIESASSDSKGKYSKETGVMSELNAQLLDMEEFVQNLSNLKNEISDEFIDIIDFLNEIVLKMPVDKVETQKVKLNEQEITNLIAQIHAMISFVHNCEEAIQIKIKDLVAKMQNTLDKDSKLFKQLVSEFDAFKAKEQSIEGKKNVHRTKSLFGSLTKIFESMFFI